MAIKFLNKPFIWIRGHPVFCGVILGVFLSLLVNRLTQEKEQDFQSIADPLELEHSNDNGTSSTGHVLENRTVAQQLFDQVKVACLIFPKNESLVNQLPNIFQTWGKRCNRFIAFVQYHSKFKSSFGFPISDMSAQNMLLFRKY
jgi:hypothetical protein